MGLMAFAGNLFFDRPGRKRSLEQLTAQLADTEANVVKRMRNAAETDSNRTQARHIIGIERWGQRRLKVALGEPFVQDEYDNYQPPADIPWNELPEQFAQTRSETITLANQLANATDTTIKHNSFGDLTVKGWLHYLNGHAKFTAMRIR